jgi:hypothetical protein
MPSLIKGGDKNFGHVFTTPTPLRNKIAIIVAIVVK